jgi:nitroreductase / dihydropteridine reductase
MNYLEDLKWRYATKRMNGKQVPAAVLNNILEAARLAPSSFGLQPFEVIVVSNTALRDELSPAIFNQPQVKEASVLLIFAAWKNIHPDNLNDYISNIAITRGIPETALQELKTVIEGSIKAKTADQIFQWNARQSYISLGFATAAAAFERVDSTPMEGFNAAEVNRILKLEERGLSAVTMLALGYRDEAKDKLANAPKVRRKAESFFKIYDHSVLI